MDIKKLKVGDVLSIDFNDIHSNSNGWVPQEEALKETPALCRGIGTYLGMNKEKEIVLAALTSLDSDQHGIRLYIPSGTVVRFRKFK